MLMISRHVYLTKLVQAEKQLLSTKYLVYSIGIYLIVVWSMLWLFIIYCIQLFHLF